MFTPDSRFALSVFSIPSLKTEPVETVEVSEDAEQAIAGHHFPLKTWIRHDLM